MATRLKVLQRNTRCNSSTVQGLVANGQASALALGMASLYKECLSQIVKDENIAFHVLMMPTMTGHHYTYALQDEEDLAQDIANLHNVVIRPNDCLVILGHDILNQDISEDEMLRIVLSDVAFHIRRLKQITHDKHSCHGKIISWAAITSVLVAAHPIMRTFTGIDDSGPSIEVLTFKEEIRRRAVKALEIDRKYNALTPESMCEKIAAKIIGRVCAVSEKTKGGYISLPASIDQIQEVASELVFDAVNEHMSIEG